MKDLVKRIAKHLGIDPLPVKFEKISDDSRIYFQEGYIAINENLKGSYIECAKSIAHEMRHVFQIYYAKLMNDERAKRWLDEMKHQVNSENMNSIEDYYTQELELDAFAFTKFYLENYEGIEVIHKMPMYEKVIEAYIIKNKEIM